MSQENVEVVRRTMDAYNTRDLPAYFDMLSESVRFQSRFSAMGRVYHGHDDLRRYFAELDEVWFRYEMRVLRLVPAGRQFSREVGTDSRGSSDAFENWGYREGDT
jgi:hypothetical protein